MTGCCPPPQFDGVSAAYKRVLWIVIAINASMFVVEISAGATAHSAALWADALDFLGDTVTYLLSLAVIGHSIRWRASAALVKGISLGFFGIWVLGMTIFRVFGDGVPEATVMGAIGLLALAANVISALLLLKFRDGDANVRSVWLCSRNDAIGNIAVVLAASGVWASGTGWPDLAVAAIMAGLFLSSAVQITMRALHELREEAAVS
ncbi:MAG: cation transporter [Alphaproteobacteria bacterium]